MFSRALLAEYKHLKIQAVVVVVAMIYYSTIFLKLINDIFILDFLIYLGILYIFILKVKNSDSKYVIWISSLTVIPFLLLPHSDFKEILRFIVLTALIFAYLLTFLKETLYSKPILFVVISMIIILFVGTLGVYYYENLSLNDAFWITFISATTVGYGDVVVVTEYGRLIIIFIIISGTLIFGAILTTLVLENLQKSRIKNEIKRQNKNSVNKKERVSYLFSSFKNGELTLDELENYLKDVVEEKNDRSKKSE